jgi:uncharacterized protein YdeI (YjbR/CyaY-like superfamily)
MSDSAGESLKIGSISSVNTTEQFYPTSREEWRQWLAENHATKQSVWVVHYKKKAAMPSVSWSDAVDEALCFGWIDSVRRPLDGERYLQFFGRRKPNGTWSKVNKEKVVQLIASNQMTPAGLASIETAKKNGSWTILDEVEELIIPLDLERAFDEYSGSQAFFLGLSKSVRKVMLSWLVMAKLPETRQKRIREIAECASQQRKPKQF